MYPIHDSFQQLIKTSEIQSITNLPATRLTFFMEVHFQFDSASMWPDSELDAVKLLGLGNTSFSGTSFF